MWRSSGCIKLMTKKRTLKTPLKGLLTKMDVKKLHEQLNYKLNAFSGSCVLTSGHLWEIRALMKSLRNENFVTRVISKLPPRNT